MSSLLIDVWTSPCSLRGVLEVAFRGKSSLLLSEKAEARFPCVSVSHWDRCATSPVPTYVRLVVFSCPCRDWIQSRGEGNLALLLKESPFKHSDILTSTVFSAYSVREVAQIVSPTDKHYFGDDVVISGDRILITARKNAYSYRLACIER